MNATKITIEQMKVMQRDLERQGFRHECTVLAGNSPQSGIWYSHADGRRAAIRMGQIEYHTPKTEGGAA